jgi:hypothetical protein
VDRLGIEIAHVVAGAVNDEAMRRQRVQCLPARGVIDDLHLEAGRRQIETVLVEERLARRLQCSQQRAAKQQRDRRHHAEQRLLAPRAKQRRRGRYNRCHPFHSFSADRESLFGSDWIRTGLYSFVLTCFLYANRRPLRSKTL